MRRGLPVAAAFHGGAGFCPLHGPDGAPVGEVVQGQLCAIRTPGVIRRGDKLYKFVDADAAQ